MKIPRLPALVSIVLLLPLPCAVLAAPATGLVGHWNLDKNASSPHGGWSGELISQGVITSGSQVLGSGCYYRGTVDGYLQTNCPGITGSSARAISVWFKTDTDIGTYDTICGWGQSSAGRRYDFRVDGGNLRIEINGTGKTMSLPRPVNDGQWHHALLSFIGGDFRNHTLYVDGKLAGSASDTSATVNTSNSTQVRIGTGTQRHQGGATNSRDFDGWIDDFGLFDRDLPATDAALIHGLGRLGIDLGGLQAARDLWDGPRYGTATIRGRSWVKTLNLAGTLGDVRGSLATNDASIVLDHEGNGIALEQLATSDHLVLTERGPFNLELSPGRSSAFSITLSNQSDTYAAEWELLFEERTGDSMADILERLNNGIEPILAFLPDRHLFFGGEASYYISDGGNDMYNTGNILDLDGSLVFYSDNAVLDIPVASGSASYFTRKFPGLFVFSAELENIDEFSITGNLGADGAGTVTAEQFELRSGGHPYTALVKRVHGSSDASINHLILVPRNPSITRDHETSTRFENHRVGGLPPTTRIHYLLFAKPYGGFYETSTFEALATAYLDTINDVRNWVEPSAWAGRLPVYGSTRTDFTIDGTGLDPGIYSKRFAFVPAGTTAPDVPAGAWQDLNLTVAQASLVDLRLTPDGPHHRDLDYGLDASLALTLANDHPTLDALWQVAFDPSNQPGLENPLGPTSWFEPDILSGRITPGGETIITTTLSAEGLDPGDYASRFAIVPRGTDAGTLPAEAWQDVSITVAPPVFALETPPSGFATVEGLDPEPLELRVVPTAGNPVPTGLAASSSAPWLIPGIDPTDPTLIRLETDVSQLGVGPSFATLSIWNGDTKLTVTIRIDVTGLHITRLLPDPRRPRLYAINTDGTNRGSVLVIDTLAQEVVMSIPVGREPTDFDLTENAAELLVINNSDPSISRIDLDTLVVTRTHQLAKFAISTAFALADVEDGPGNVLYYVDEQSGPRLRVFDSVTETVLQTFGANPLAPFDNSPTSHGFGDIIVNEDQTRLFGWASNRIHDYSFVVAFDITPAGTLVGHTASGTIGLPNFQRDPEDTPPLMTSDGSRLIIKDREVDQDDLGNYPVIFGDEIYALSAHGELASSAGSIFPGTGGGALHPFSTPTTVQAYTPDSRHLVYFDPSDAALHWLDLIETFGPSTFGLEICPADGSLTTAPAMLRWLPQTGVTRFHVYLGTDPEAIAQATPESPEFLGEAAGTTLNIPPLPGAVYYWRVAPVRADGSAVVGTTRTFAVAPLTFSQASVETFTVQGMRDHRGTLRLDAPTPTDWSATSPVPWLGFTEFSGTTPSTLSLVFDTVVAGPGDHSTEISITANGVTMRIPVHLKAYPLHYTLAEADQALPRIYTVSQENNRSEDPSFLVIIDSVSGDILSATPVGTSVTDLAVHYGENRIYVANWRPGVLRALDRTTLEEVQTYQFTPFGGTGYGVGDVHRIAAGKPGRLVMEEADQSINMRIIDTGSGEVLATSTTAIYAGDGATDPTGTSYYHAESLSGSNRLWHFDISNDRFDEVSRADGPNGPIVISGDGSLLASQSRVFNPELRELFRAGGTVRSTSLHGELVFTDSSVYNGSNGSQIGSLPVSTPIQAVSGDQETLFLFEGSGFTTVDIAGIATLPPRGVIPSIADGSTVNGTNQTLSWTVEPFALSYDLYFGSDRDVVARATPGSAGHLGTLPGTAWSGALPSLSLGGNYFWRVDTRGLVDSRRGEVWSFDVAPVVLDPGGIDLVLPVTSPAPDQEFLLSAPRPTPWAASPTVPWIRLAESSGTIGTTLRLALDTATLPVGRHAGAVTMTSGEDTWAIPVTIEILPLNITLLKPDPGRPGVIYGINHHDPAENTSHLVRINGADGTITASLPVGPDPTDLDVDAWNDLLYINNHGHQSVRVIDLDSWSERSVLELDQEVFRLEVDAGGRLYSQRKFSSGITIWDLDTLTRTQLGGDNGDLEIDATGRHLYHAGTSTNARITKYDLSTESVAEIAASWEFGYNTRRLIASLDGSRLAISDHVFDPDCNDVAFLPGDIYALSPGGELAVGDGRIWWTDGGGEIMALPFTTPVSSFSASGDHLVLFNPGSGTIHSVPTSSITALPGPWPRPGQALFSDQPDFSWTPVPDATGYVLTISGDPDGPRRYEGITGASFTPPGALTSGRHYTWRVDAITPGGTVAGETHGFTINFPHGLPIDGASGDGSGKVVALGSDSLLIGGNGFATAHSFDPVTGGSTLRGHITGRRSHIGNYFGHSVTVSPPYSFVGAHEWDEPEDNCGAVFAYGPSRYGSLDLLAQLNPDPVIGNEHFGGGLAADGDTLMAGSGGPTSVPGRVLVYLTQPSLTPTQILTPANQESPEQFGARVAIDGNTAVITDPARSVRNGRQSAAYVFTRSAETGLWSEQQRITASTNSSSDELGWAVALSGDLLAVSNERQSKVHLYERNASGIWQSSIVIAAKDVPGASGSFADSLAIGGDTLFVGDPSASSRGRITGRIFTFMREGGAWLPGVSISPDDQAVTGFGTSLDARDGWLLVGGNGSNWLYRIASDANHSPAFTSSVDGQVVSGRLFELPVHATDPDGPEGTAIEAVQLPGWLELTDHGSGRATLRGTPTAPSGTTYDVQLRATDPDNGVAFRTFRLTVLAKTDVPVLTAHPSGGDYGTGQEMILRGSVDGIGPFAWQWQHNGMDIPGANEPALIIPELSPGDAGSYILRVGNVVSTTVSDPAIVTVRSATRFAGPWSTFGSGPRHAGLHPATLGRHTFVPAWSAAIHPSSSLNRAAIAEGRVYVTPNSRFDPGAAVEALDLHTGGTLWRHPLPTSFSLNPPAWHAGRLYVQRGKGINDPIGPQLICLDAANGTERWTSIFGAQWEHYEAPTVTDEGVWINAGSYGGMYGFSPDGSERFFINMTQTDGWTPAVTNGRLFTSLQDSFTEHDPASGKTIWSVKTSQSDTSIPVISGDRAVVMKQGKLSCIDLDNRTILWESESSELSSAHPAVAGGRVYAIKDNAVREFSLETGTLLRTFEAGNQPRFESQQPLILNDHLVAATSTHTFVFDLLSGGLAQTLEAGGLLSYSEGHLLAAGPSGTLHAFFANAAPEFASTVPSLIDAGPAAASRTVPMAAHAIDPDPGDPLAWTILSVSNPALFRSMEIDPSTGDLAVDYNPWQSGESDVLLSMTDSAGNSTRTSLHFRMPAHPAPDVAVDAALVFNRQTGLYEQSITITNVGAREIAGFELNLSGIPDGVTVHNASARTEAGAIIHHHQVLAAGSATTLVLEYHAPVRGVRIDPDVGISLVTAPDTDPAAPDGGFAIDRCLPLGDGSMLIEFRSVPGDHYEIHYSEDALDWKLSPTPVRASGNRVQWIDRGPPRTDTLPGLSPCRFYRIRRIGG